jgi:hypothetical protein
MSLNTKTEKRYCKIRDIPIKIVLEGVSEMGSDITKWSEKKCLDKNKSVCKHCMFTEMGGENPFS